MIEKDLKKKEAIIKLIIEKFDKKAGTAVGNILIWVLISPTILLILAKIFGLVNY